MRPSARRLPAQRLTLIGVLISVLVLFWVLLVAPQPTATAQFNNTPTPLPLYALPDARAFRASGSSSIALHPDGRTVATANMINDSVTIAIPTFDRIIAEVTVGRDPRGVAITPNGIWAIVTNRINGTLSVVTIDEPAVVATIPLGGIWPYGVLTLNDTTAVVSLLGSDQIAVVDLVNRAVLSLIAVPDAPAGLAVWGDFLYVTHFWSGNVSMIYLPTGRVYATVPTGSDTGLTQSFEIDITRGIAYLTQTRLNTQNPALTYDTVVFPVVNVLNLRDLSLIRSGRITLDTADQAVNMPFASALDRFAQRLYIANAGSDSISVIDVNTGEARAHIAVGANPRSVLLNNDNSKLYVHNALEGTLTTIDTNALAVISVLPLIDLRLSLDLLIGAQLFNNASDSRLSTNDSLSCATCHFDGMSDGRVWLNFPEGPRNTPLLYKLPETVPYNWSATWDELSDVELKIRALQGGTGLVENGLLQPAQGSPHVGLSLDLDLLTAYITSIQAPPPVATDHPLRARGEAVFAEQACASCHVGPAGTDLQQYDVSTGTGATEKGGMMFDTPTLRWLWLSAPYLHDGSATTLNQLFAMTGTHQLIYEVAPEDIDALIAYLLSFAMD